MTSLLSRLCLLVEYLAWTLPSRESIIGLDSCFLCYFFTGTIVWLLRLIVSILALLIEFSLDLSLLSLDFSRMPSVSRIFGWAISEICPTTLLL